MKIQYASIPTYAVLKFEGEDSLSFLQAQLSQDMSAVKAETALLASYSTAKGRVYATLLLWQDHTTPQTYYALVRADIATLLVKRLRMYVLRAKVNISIATAQITGIWSENKELSTEDKQTLEQLIPLSQALLSIPTSASTIPHFTVSSHEQQYLIHYPNANTSIRLLNIHIIDDINQENTLLITLDKVFQESHWKIWHQQDILIALPWIGNKTKELFVAQSINQDTIGAINFKKGCYPGQEVIARNHYLGKVKRRTLIVKADIYYPDADTILPGTDILEGENPVGQVVDAIAIVPHTYLLVEIQLNSLEDGKKLYLAEAPEENILIFEKPPYSLEKPE